jgi:hypothetical protein
MKPKGLYIRVTTDALTDADVLFLGAEAWWLFSRGLLYSKQHQLDGHVPTAAVEVIGLKLKKPEAVAKALVDAGLWEKAAGGWYAVNWHKYQTSKAEDDEQRDRERTKKQKQRGTNRHVPDLSPGDICGDNAGDTKGTHPIVPAQQPEPEPEPEPEPKCVVAEPTTDDDTTLPGLLAQRLPNELGRHPSIAMPAARYWRAHATRPPVVVRGSQIDAEALLLACARQAFAEPGFAWEGWPQFRNFVGAIYDRCVNSGVWPHEPRSTARTILPPPKPAPAMPSGAWGIG